MAVSLQKGQRFDLTGSKATVQALGDKFGSLANPPYILLDKDDRTGESSDGENLYINGAMLPRIKRILVFTHIYEGVTDWREANGEVTVKIPGKRDIIVRMDEYGSSKRVCAVALIENNGDGSCSIEKTVSFFTRYEEMSEAYHWGLKWYTARK